MKKRFHVGALRSFGLRSKGPAIALVLAASAASAASAAGPVALYVAEDGSLAFDGGKIALECFTPGWGGVRTKPAPGTGDAGAPGGRCDVFDASRNRLFLAVSEWRAGTDGAVEGDVSLECVSPCSMQSVSLSLDSPVEPTVGAGDGFARECSAKLGGGRSLCVSFASAVAFHCQDDSQWSGSWRTRFGGALEKRDFVPGDVLRWRVRLVSPSGLSLERARPVQIREGEGWTRLVGAKDPVPGSALDFSGLGFVDAPAGKHGFLVARGGRFEFEGLPGVPQRFHGVNLCFSACFPDPATAETLVDRLVRSGYDSVRIHHHDGQWHSALAKRGDAAPAGGRASASPPSAVDDAIARFDYLAFLCLERGLYLSTDLFVSRPVPWRALGEDRDGNVDPDLYKTLVGVDDAAFADWADHARAFLEHVNPHTGRAWKDEPGAPFLSLVNECRLSTGWPKKAADPRVVAAWGRFCDEAAIADAPKAPPAPGAPRFAEFEEWVQRRTYERCAAFVRSLGCRALLTNDNNGPSHAPGQGCTGLYDYVDNHFYVDHPRFPDRQWRLPSRLDGASPVLAGKPPLLHRGWAGRADRPYTASEWNFCGPGRFRAAGGLLVGALAANGGWDGLWRFAYAHDAARIHENASLGPGYFDAALDPAVAASDRAVAFLFRSSPVLRLDRDQGAAAVVAPLVCGGFAESGPIEAGPLHFTILTPPLQGVRGAASPTLRGAASPTSRGAASPTLRGAATPTSQGVRGAASPTSAAVPATLWVSSLDGVPLERSSRMLLAFVTDVQGEGAAYSDGTRSEIVKWGRGCLVQDGAADVSLRHAAPEILRVWALDAAGNRLFPVETAVSGGAVRFRACTATPAGAVLFFEIESAPATPSRQPRAGKLQAKWNTASRNVAGAFGVESFLG